MDSEIISNCVGPLSRDYLSKLPHHITPCMNLHNVLPYQKNADNVSSLLFKQFPYSSSVPVPLMPLTKLDRKVLNGIDPTTLLIREKIRWQMKKDKIIKTVKKDKKTIREKMFKKIARMPVDYKAVVPRGIVFLAQHLDKDPDPCFSGVNNWYYTGGTLAVLKCNDGHYLLHANDSKLNFSRMVQGNQCESTSTMDLNSDEPIYQVITNSNGAAVRQKSHVNVLSVQSSDSGLQLNKLHSIHDKKHPFLSVALQKYSNKRYCTISNNKILKLWDVEYSRAYKCKLQMEPGEGITVTDNWSSLQFFDNRTLLLADRCCLHVLDTRADMKEKQMAWCPKKITELCEELSYFVCSSLRDQVVYIVTTHQTFCLDLRFGFCQRWTHMMAASPFFGFTRVMDNEHELLCIGSQILSDCVTIVNTWEGEEPRSLYKPSCLPSPAEGLHLARQHGVCLDPTLIQRCTQSMIGLTYLPADHGLNIVRQSATFDIFIQQLNHSEQSSKQITERDLTTYSEWCKPALELERDPTTIAVTEVKNLVPVLKVITDTTIPTEKTVKDDNVPISSGWQMSKEYMEDCVDMLAGKMLAVWEVEEEDEWAVDFEDEESIVEQDPAERVLNWLDGANPGNTTTDDRNITDISALKPTVTSTPFPVPATEKEVCPSSPEPSPWAPQFTQANQQTPNNKHSRADFSPYRQMFSPPSSVTSDKHQQKKLKIFDDTVMTTPIKQFTDIKRPQSSAKKKFIAGF